MPAARREAMRALWQVDAALGAVVAGASDKMIARIKLAWWRESLEKIDSALPPAQPVLEAVARDILPLGISGSALSEIEAGWSILLGEEALSAEELDAYAVGRGRTLFTLSAKLLGAAPTGAQMRAGEGWALMDLARHSGQPDADAALDAARARLSDDRWPKTLRPLGMLVALARRDAKRGLGNIEMPGAPARMLAMLRHRVTGR